MRARINCDIFAISKTMKRTLERVLRHLNGITRPKVASFSHTHWSYHIRAHVSLRNRERIATTNPDVCARARARIVCLRRPNERADGCSKVVVLTQIKQHLVQVLTSNPLAAHTRSLSLSLSYIHFLSPCDNTDNGNVTCARPPTGNIAMRTPRMQIHSVCTSMRTMATRVSARLFA